MEKYDKILFFTDQRWNINTLANCFTCFQFQPIQQVEPLILHCILQRMQSPTIDYLELDLKNNDYHSIISSGMYDNM